MESPSWSPNSIELPDELILKVLAYLKTKDLKRCGQVSRRFRNICQDYQESIMESEACLEWSRGVIRGKTAKHLS